MKYVEVNWSGELDGHIFSAEPYLAALPAILSRLPRGARDFASDSSHYDFGSAYCVKDLQLDRICAKTPDLGLRFTGNPWKHVGDLLIEYQGVFAFDYNHTAARGAYDWHPLVLLDEILPADGGFIHEIALGSGDLVIRATDLAFRWERWNENGSS